MEGNQRRAYGKKTRRSILKGSATLGVLGLGTGVGAADDPPSSSGDGSEKGGKPVEPHTGGGGVGTMSTTDDRVLVIKDCNPWYAAANEYVLNEMGVSYKVINSHMVDDEDFGAYSAVVVPSTQSETFYRRLVRNREKLARYVENGGTLVGHVGTDGYPCYGNPDSTFLPRGVGHVENYYQYVTAVRGSHPILDGISDRELDRWNYSTHGYLTNVPGDATVVAGISGNAGDRPTLVEYGHGDGRVLASTHTMEWPWAQSYSGTKELLRNELDHALTGSRPDPVSDLQRLVDQKKELAGSIDSVSQNIREQPRVEATLNSLTGKVDDGELAEEEAVDAVKRMLLGENVTEAALAAIGPAGDGGSYEADDHDLDVDTPDDVESYDTAKIAVDGAISTLVGILLSNKALGRAKRLLPDWAADKVDEALEMIDDLVADIVSVVIGGFDKAVRKVRGKAFKFTDELEEPLKDGGEKAGEKIALKLFDKISQVDKQLAGILTGIFETDTPDSLDGALVNLDNDLGGDGTIDATGDLPDAAAEAQDGLDQIKEQAEGAKQANDALSLATTFVDIMEVIGVALAATGVLALGAAAVELAALVLNTLFNITKALVGVGTVEEVVDIQNETLDGVVAPEGGV